MACTQTGAPAAAVVVREVLMDRLLCEMRYPGPGIEHMFGHAARTIAHRCDSELPPAPPTNLSR
jgi:hypothetical protein